MAFSSVEFLFLFLPLVLFLYHGPFHYAKKWRNVLLLMASLVFYAWGEGILVVLLVGSALFNWMLGHWIEKHRERRWSFSLLIFGVAANLAALVFWKYSGFIFENVRPVLGHFGLFVPNWQGVHLPIGISFFTFQALTYIVDIWRGDAISQRSPMNVALYISLFPQLIAGPIVRYRQIAAQITERILTRGEFSRGIERFIIGLAKKTLIADTLGRVADHVFALQNGQVGTLTAWMGAVSFMYQVYFDFSGYSDMAIGLGHMFGFKFPENFRHPYAATSIRDFWRRWHMTLSGWFRDYVYIPMGGNQRRPLRVSFNLLLVFLLCGLWHGASWTFVVWGLYHGFFLVAERIRKPNCRLTTRGLKLVAPLYVFVVVLVGWVIFRSDSLGQATNLLGSMIGVSGGSTLTDTWPLNSYLNPEVLVTLLIAVIGALPLVSWIRNCCSRMCARRVPGWFLTATWASEIRGAIRAAILLAVFLLAVLKLGSGAYSPFIYFRF